MFRKTISIVLCSILLLCMSVPAFATPNETEPAEAKTVEEILNDYHEKSFLIQRMAETDTPTAYSRQGEALRKTLEEETVDELTAAGYEAYNVTSENYGDLEVALMTNFAELGLDPNGSYIVVLSGENHPNQTNPTSRSGIPPEESLEGGDGGSSYFGYQYNGDTYYLRYVTVTSATGTDMRSTGSKAMRADYWYEHPGWDMLDTLIVAGVDYVSGFPLGTILQLTAGMAADDRYIVLEDDTLTLHADTVWTCSCIQVWNDTQQYWSTTQCSAYADSQAKCVGFIYDSGSNKSIWYDGALSSTRKYSPYYSQYTLRQDNAVKYFLLGRISYDYTGDINFYLTDGDGNVIYTSSNRPFITHLEQWDVPSASY